MHKMCTSHSIQQEADTRVVKNLEERNVGKMGKSPKQDLTNTKGLTIELSEGRESPTIEYTN